MFAKPQRKPAQTHAPGGRHEPSAPGGATAPDPRAPGLDAVQRRAHGSASARTAQAYQTLLNRAPATGPADASGGPTPAVGVVQRVTPKRRRSVGAEQEPKRRRRVAPDGYDDELGFGGGHGSDDENDDGSGVDSDGEIDVGFDEPFVFHGGIDIERDDVSGSEHEQELRDDIDRDDLSGGEHERELRDDLDEDDGSGSDHEREMRDDFDEDVSGSEHERELDDDSDDESGGHDAPRIHVGIGTFNINHLGKKSEKKEAKLQAIDHLFGSNEWLELLALQEVNDPEVLRELGRGVKVLGEGPHMRTVGVKQKGGKGRGGRGAKANGGGNQDATREIYPLLARAGSGWELEGTQVFRADEEEPEDWKDGEELIWRDRTGQGAVERQIETAKLGIPRKRKETRDAWFNRMEAELRGLDAESDGEKKVPEDELKLLERRKALRNEEDGKTRPVVIYRLRNEKDGRRLNVAVVHTTPSGQEFARRDVFAQVSGFLEYMNEAAGGEDEDNASWVLLGDFYLTPEAEVTRETNSSERKKRDSFGLHFPDPVVEQELLDDPPEARYPNLELAHAISASNWPTMHQKHGERTKVQIADFMIVSNNFRDRTAGLFDRFGSGVWPVDHDHLTLEAWMPTTDHAPVGGMLSSERDDDRVEAVRRQAEERAFPPHIRALANPGMLEPDEFARHAKDGEVPSLELDESDGMFFLTPEEMERVPFGDYNQFTHDIVGMAAEIRRRAPEVDNDLAPMGLEAVLADNTTMGGVLFDLQHLPPDVYAAVQDALPAVWNDHRRHDG